ncbi:GldG family protein [Nitrosomonas communis]|uniref:GldG family protein n=1 Tax=Nitrosomonas communis TaxID=44574 RepID=UPI0026F36F7D|nr:GldG family protein [Nitrosomonas communis]MCO6427215.1 GldG family protein [Nitrosomonas communis]
MITVNKKLRAYLLLQNGLFVVLLLILMGMLGYLAMEFRTQWDISQSGRNSLSEASLEVLQKLNGPVSVTVYATPQDAQLGDIRKIISDFMTAYQRVKPDLELNFIDPVEQPNLAQEAGVRMNGEMVITFNGRSEHLTTINEQTFTNALMRLARSEQKQLMMLSGHGERKLDGIANRDLGDFGRKLAEAGFKSEALNFASTPEIPSNTSVLIVASPQTDLLAGEVEKLLDYIEHGGNLLWLVDQEPLYGLLPLAEKLGLTFTPGVVVDPQAKRLRAPITFALGTIYGQHDILENFDFITVFPFARQIIFNENEEWHGTSLVEVAPQGWVETSELNDEATFDEADDVAGPVSVAVALDRIVDDREQRIVVIGSGHLLANTYLGNGGNIDFGINLVNWLAGDEDLIAIQPRATIDSQLMLSESEITVIVIGFLIVFPLLFLFSGLVIWWRRRRR